ncbi:hypothetical protein CP973_15070 [Streptomyces albofaciens JCM 4342]|nr:hypothetical protein CP973_15070 [Streptomyces albofaciens JCM 4342]
MYLAVEVVADALTQSVVEFSVSLFVLLLFVTGTLEVFPTAGGVRSAWFGRVRPHAGLVVCWVAVCGPLFPDRVLCVRFRDKGRAVCELSHGNY